MRPAPQVIPTVQQVQAAQASRVQEIVGPLRPAPTSTVSPLVTPGVVAAGPMPGPGLSRVTVVKEPYFGNPGQEAGPLPAGVAPGLPGVVAPGPMPENGMSQVTVVKEPYFGNNEQQANPTLQEGGQDGGENGQVAASAAPVEAQSSDGGVETVE